MPEPQHSKILIDDQLVEGLGDYESLIEEVQCHLDLNFGDDFAMGLLVSTTTRLLSQFPESTVWNATMVEAFSGLLVQGAIDKYSRHADQYARFHLQKMIDFLQTHHSSFRKTECPRDDTKALKQELKVGWLLKELLRRQTYLPELDLMTVDRICEFRILGIPAPNQILNDDVDKNVSEAPQRMTAGQAKRHEARRVRVAAYAREEKQERKRERHQRTKPRDDEVVVSEEDRGRRRRRSHNY